MQKLVNKNIDYWIRPWEIEKFDNISNRDERFFSLLIKGILTWLNSNIVMYNKPIKHFILNTGTAYLYLEKTGYEYKWCDTTGEDIIYHELPRCLATIGNFSVETEELGAPAIPCKYERISTAEKTKGEIVAYTGEMYRIPVQLDINLNYVFSNFNESIIFIQELMEKILFQQYFNIIYLGQSIQCSIEFSKDTSIKIENPDLASKETNTRKVELQLTINTNLPVINPVNQQKASNFITEYVDYTTNKGGIYHKKTGEYLGGYKKPTE